MHLDKIQNNKVNLKIEFFQEGDFVLATLPSLQITAQGKSRVEAEVNILELIDIFFEENDTIEKLEAVLLDCGWSKGVKFFYPPKEIGSLYKEVDFSFA